MGYMRDKRRRRLDSHGVNDLNPVYHLNAYENFFLSAVGGTQNVWVSGQSTTATTLTSAVTAGATVLPVASASGISAGVILVTGAGTSTQQVHRVASVAGSNVTLTAAVANNLSNGATVAPLWTNESHLTDDSVGGTKAFGYFVAQAKDSSGNYIISGANQKVTWLGDSWTLQSLIQFTATLQGRMTGCTVVNAGVAGNTLAAMLARFDTDVPSDSNFVVIEFGVNDVYNNITGQSLLATLETVIQKVRAIGATPIVTGIVPLVVNVAGGAPGAVFQSGARQQEIKAALADGKTYPAIAGSGGDSRYMLTSRYGVGSLGIGTTSLDKTTTGDFNTALGYIAGRDITSGGSNTMLGYSAGVVLASGSGNTYIGSNAGKANQSGSSNTAVGDLALGAATSSGANNSCLGRFALLSQTTATDNTAMGFQTGRAVTTGPSNTMIGYGAGYDANAVAANATTTATGQTLVGKQTGQGSTTQRDYITCLGYRTTADGAGAVAIGTDSGGAGAAATAANEIALGTANHFVKVRGRTETAASTTTTAGLRVAHGTAPTSPVDGDVWTTTAGMFVRINGTTKTVTLT